MSSAEVFQLTCCKSFSFFLCASRVPTTQNGIQLTSGEKNSNNTICWWSSYDNKNRRWII